MEYIGVILVAAIAFGVFFLIDKGFTRLFRSQAQHQSGLAIRVNKRYCSFGLILCVLGIGSAFASAKEGWIMLVAGCIILLVGAGLIVYYMTFGVFYNEDGFVLTTFGKRSTTYRYNQIAGQLLYNASGNVLIELHMKDGRSVNLQSTMTGAYAFLDYAFEKWCRQTGKNPDDCDFHDPDNSLWFPLMEG